jgi:eukaryotic-like serine/threonine-protein kinase
VSAIARPDFFCARCGHTADTGGACPTDGEHLVRLSVQDLPGRLIGEYRVLAKLGGGAFGTVYRVAHTTTGTIRAIKLLSHPIDHKESERVVIEARAASKIAHPNCVEVFDLQQTADRRPYIVMQLLDGVSLAQVIKKRLSIAEALTLISDVLRGIGAAHAQGVIHRDLKPGNIFVANGRAVVVDFGFAKLLGDPKAPNLSITGEVLGTPAYMAPEQITAGRPIDGRADLYAVAVVLYEMLANKLPFAGKSALQMMGAHLNQVALPVTAYRPDCPKHVADAIGKAMAKDPDARFRDADAMRTALTMSPGLPVWAYVALAIIAAAIVIVLARALG